jgi:hypothetical protein
MKFVTQMEARNMLPSGLFLISNYRLLYLFHSDSISLSGFYSTANTIPPLFSSLILCSWYLSDATKMTRKREFLNTRSWPELKKITAQMITRTTEK